MRSLVSPGNRYENRMKIGMICYENRSLGVLSSYKMLHCKKDASFERTRLIFFRNKNIARPSWITLRFFHFNFEERRESVNLLMYVLFTDMSKLLLCR